VQLRLAIRQVVSITPTLKSGENKATQQRRALAQKKYKHPQMAD